MSTYYEYKDVKVMIAHKLMKMEGWKIYGYKEDRSDSMTDYYDPANWDGVAEKNGYILCVNVYGASEPKEIRKYTYKNFSYDSNIKEKIKKLENMTIERGASEQEEKTAKLSIERLQKKAEENTENQGKYIVTGIIPGHQANPPRCNWHIEKDGMIIAKGNGILKYASVDNYFNYENYRKSYDEFKKLSKEEYIRKDAEYNLHHGYYSDIERAKSVAESHYKNMVEDAKLIEEFEAFINKLDTTCGGLLGEGDGTIYEKVTITEYKKENKVFETENGSIKDGQCFILKTSFNYGRYKGLVYRIREIGEEGQKYFTAYKLNKKLTKECHGMASQNNTWYIGTDDRLTKWIEKGDISWCEIKEVKTAYDVEKVVKKTIKATNKAEKETKLNNINNVTFTVSEDTDTRDYSKIWIAKINKSLDREEYKKVNAYIKSIGGYYSKFKHGFIFKENPTNLLNVTITENETNTNSQETERATEKPVSYSITEDTHTKTGEKLYIVKPDTELSRADFLQVKQKLATLQGYYSSFVKGFIFKYDPTEKLEVV